MVRVLTAEEARESDFTMDLEANLWWKSLTSTQRIDIRSYNKPLIDQATCDHEWRDMMSYEEKITRCAKCNASRKISIMVA